MLQEVIDFLDHQFSMKDATILYRDQWQTLKSAVLAAQPTNCQSAPCSFCGRAVTVQFPICFECRGKIHD
jgi:hypothetical protein